MHRGPPERPAPVIRPVLPSASRSRPKLTRPPACDGDILIGTEPASYRENFQAVQFTVQTDPLSSPFYRRPVGLDSHPRVMFDEGTPEAELIIEWIGGGGT